MQVDRTDGADLRPPELVGEVAHEGGDARRDVARVVAKIHRRGAGVVRLADDW